MIIEQNTEARLVMSIIDLANRLTKKGNDITSTVGLTTQQWIILLYLAGDPNVPPVSEPRTEGMLASELASALNVSRPNITNMINVLMKKGLVEQVENAIDRRQKLLKPTESGYTCLKKLEPFRHQTNRKLFEALSKTELSMVLDSLDQCLMRLYNKQEEVH